MDYARSRHPPSEPQTFGRYKVCKLLGEGAMGRVYLAEDPVLDRLVAIKVIAVDKQPDGRTKEEYLRRFDLEARASAKLSHPSIVTIFDAGEECGLPWIAFEYVDGDQLEMMLAQPGLLPVDKIVSVTLDITAALHHAHECGIIHRDIKPANILIDKRTHIAKLSDFGVVKAPWVALTQDGSAVGSPGYMSPEQLDGTGTDARSDLFSLGIVLYQMLTGKHPFLRNSIPATIFATLHSNYQPITELRPDAPPYLVAIAGRLLQNDRNKRIQTAALLLHELRLGNKPIASGLQNQPAFDENALLGNTTRIKRISHTLQSLGKKGMDAVARSPRLHMAGRRILSRIDELSGRIPLPESSRHVLLVAVPGLLLFFCIVILFSNGISSLTHDERAVLKELRMEGFHGNPHRLIDTCEFLIAREQLSEAKELAAKLSLLRNVATHARLLLGRIALLDGEDREAVEAFTKASARKDWRKTRKRELPSLMHSCIRRLSDDSVDSTLAAVLAATVFINRKDSVRAWIGAPPYWLRWNSVRLAGLMNIPVDSVDLYILDLQHAGSVRTRTRAATRLGELGDKRAIAPLKTAMSLGLKDPVVSYTAELVLENYFRDTTGGK